MLESVFLGTLCDYSFLTWKHLRPPNVRQMLHKRELRFRTASTETPPRGVERELRGAKFTWQEWSKIRMYSDTATRIWSLRTCRTHLFHHVGKNDWRPWHFVHHLRQVVVFLWAPVSSSPTHTAFLWFDKFWQISNQQSMNGEKRGESLTGGCGSGKYFLS